MKKLIFLLIIFLNACTVLPIDQVKNKLDQNFTYVDMQYRYQAGNTGESKFIGNCVSYSDAAKYQLKKLHQPVQQWFVKTETNEFHMVTCSKDVCIDNRLAFAFQKGFSQYTWLEQIQ